MASMVVMEPGDLGSIKSPHSPRMLSPSRNSVIDLQSPEDKKFYVNLGQRIGKLQKKATNNNA